MGGNWLAGVGGVWRLAAFCNGKLVGEAS
jgi:hypothetical protein